MPANKIKAGYVIFLIFFGVVVRTALLNINSAEWGDSYRILRASNYVRNLTYPDDEKRPPLFSILLAVRPNNIDPVLWGRIFMLGISFLTIYIFYKLSKKYLANQNQQFLAVTLLILNPVYLYWSLRIYADVPFSLLVLLCFYAFEVWRAKLEDGTKSSAIHPIVMGLICSLGILTRFEGYLLAFAMFIGILVTTRSSLMQWLKTSAAFILTTGIVVLPWLLYRNPLTSSYLEEPTGRSYGLEMLASYLVSYVFVLGIIPAGSILAAFFVNRSSITLPSVLKKYPHIATFVLLESFLILAWPAAIPRLFVPVIPLLIIAFVKNVEWLFTKRTGLIGAAAIALTVVYIVAQGCLRLQFLGPNTLVYISIGMIAIVSAVSIAIGRYKLFLGSAVVSMTVLAASTVYMHKDIYLSIKEISVFSLREIRGNIIHNDTASIVNWYFPESRYKNLDNKNYLTQAYLEENQVDYIILTNEFNPNLEIDLKKRPYLELVKESRYNTGGKMFFTWLVKVQR